MNKKVSKDPGAITAVVISHGHGDHTGGLGKILEANARLKVFIPQSFSEVLMKARADHPCQEGGDN